MRQYLKNIKLDKPSTRKMVHRDFARFDIAGTHLKEWLGTGELACICDVSFFKIMKLDKPLTRKVAP